jgi:hypothetical protein
VRLLAATIALGLAFPLTAEISLCPNGQPELVARHGAAQAHFYLPLDPSLNAAQSTTIRASGNEVLIDVTLGPSPGPPLPNPSCFFISTDLAGSLGPGDYTARWTVRRMVSCGAGACEAERGGFTRAFTVAEPLVCSGDGPQFAVVPASPVAGSPIRVWQASPEVWPYALTPPVITIEGTAIEVREIGTYTGPPPPPTLHCVSSVIDLGLLPAGNYSVRWTRELFGHAQTHTHSFAVSEPERVPALHWRAVIVLAAALALIGLRILR